MKERKLKNYKVSLDSDTYAVSLVEDPAFESDFVYMSKDEKKVNFMSDEEQHLVIGASLIPDKPIYRYNEDTGEEYYLTFTAPAIKAMAYKFMKDFRQHNITLEHEEDAPELYVVEQWIKTSMDYDKSLAVGLDPTLPIGTWFQAIYVNNVQVWEDLKEGKYTGFSVESMIGLEEFSKVEKKEDFMSDENGFWTKMKNMLQEVFDACSMKNKEEFEEAEAPQEQPQNTPIEAPETPQNMEGVEEVIEKENEPEMSQQETKTETQEEPVVETPEPVVETHEPTPSPLEELVRNLQSELNALKETNAELVEKVKDLSQLPSAKPINTVAGSGGNGDAYAQWRETMAKYL